MGLMGWMEPKGIKETMDNKGNRAIRSKQYRAIYNTLDFFYNLLIYFISVLSHRGIQENLAYQETKERRARRWRVNVFYCFHIDYFPPLFPHVSIF